MYTVIRFSILAHNNYIGENMLNSFEKSVPSPFKQPQTFLIHCFNFTATVYNQYSFSLLLLSFVNFVLVCSNTHTYTKGDVSMCSVFSKSLMMVTEVLSPCRICSPFIDYDRSDVFMQSAFLQSLMNVCTTILTYLTCL